MKKPAAPTKTFSTEELAKLPVGSRVIIHRADEVLQWRKAYGTTWVVSDYDGDVMWEGVPDAPITGYLRGVDDDAWGKNPKPIAIRYTERGFAIAEFTDRYGHPCSLQKSSLAFEDAVWFGTNSKTLSTFVPNTGGWKEVEPLALAQAADPRVTEAIMPTRMHLTRSQVAELLPLLTHFVEHGDLPSTDQETS